MTTFSQFSTAGAATLIANGGTGGAPGGLISFYDASTAGTAHIQVFGNGRLDISPHNAPGMTIASIDGTGNISIGGRTLTLSIASPGITFDGVIQDVGQAFGSGGSLTKQGAGTLTLSGANTFTGVTLISAGALKLTNSLALQNSVVTSSAALAFDSSVATHAFTFGGFTGSVNFALEDNKSGTPNPIILSVGNNNGNSLYSGRLKGTGGLTKIGTGTFTLSGPNIYTGATTVSGGLLSITGSLGNTAVTVSSGGKLSGTGTVAGPVTIANGGIVDLTGPLIINNSVTVASGGVLTGTGAINGPLIINSGGIVDLNGGTLTVNGTITNNGLIVLSNGAHLAGMTSSFTNNGTLDIITAGTFTPPAGFVNNGVIIDASVVKVKSIQRSGTNVTVSINSYTGHTYRLQKSASPYLSSFVNLLSSQPQQGNTGNVISFTDSNATGTTSFYRILVNP